MSLYSIGYNLFYFILVMSIVVFVHEFGHYLLARLNKVRVEKFSIGFGRELFSRTDKAGTRWAIGLLPIGGYVKMFGDRDPASRPDQAVVEALTPEEKKVSFQGQSLLVRALIIFAGPFANFLFGFIILTGFLMIYGGPVVQPIVSQVMENMPAFVAGVKEGDKILEIDKHKIQDFADVEQLLANASDQPMSFVIERDNEIITKEITPQKTRIKDGFGGELEVGRIGIMSTNVRFQKYNFWQASQKASIQIYKICGLTLEAIKKLVISQQGKENLSGPIRLAKYSGETAKHGIPALLWFAALISINLGIMNLLPIPLLDGGHLFFYAVEAIRGKPLSHQTQEWFFKFGMLLLLAIMLFSTVNDIILL